MFNPSTINLRELQKSLFAAAYKMIGEVAPSEDVAQETIAVFLLKSAKNELTDVVDLKKYLIKTAINRSINYLKKIKKERANYVGVWLPEPLLHFTNNLDAQIDIDYGLTFLLSRLTPKERAVFILKKAFDFTFKEIGEALNLKEATCRKTYQRLKEKLEIPSTDLTVDKTVKERLLQGFLAVGQENGMEQLINILKKDIVIYSDGGGKKSAATKPLIGAEICTKFLLGLFKKRGDELIATYTEIGGEPALQLHTLSGELDAIMLFTLDNHQVNRLFIIRNPNKLGGDFS